MVAVCVPCIFIVLFLCFIIRNEALRVAFIHSEERDSPDGKITEFYSKLVKADVNGKDQVNFLTLLF